MFVFKNWDSFASVLTHPQNESGILDNKKQVGAFGTILSYTTSFLELLHSNLIQRLIKICKNVTYIVHSQTWKLSAC